MSVEEELQEHTHHAHDPFDKRVAATMAIIAALLALVSVLGHLLTTEELLNQQKASDQWAYSQAKDIRHYLARVAHDVIIEEKGSAGVIAKYDADDQRYKNDTVNVQEKAREFEKESDLAGRKAFRMHLGEVFLEIAIVLSSLAILTKKSFVWMAGMASALVGGLIALTALLL
jgi:hypothetical protein